MECPKCRHVQSDGMTECQRCGVIFSRIPQVSDRAATREDILVRKAELSADAATRSPAAQVALILMLLVFAGIGWWLNSPSGLPVPVGAYKDADKAFALSPPADWLLITPANYRALIDEYKGRFPAHLQRFMSSKDLAVGYMRIQDREGSLPPTVNVIAMSLKNPLPPLTEADKTEGTKLITAELAKNIANYELISSRIVTIDKQKSLELTSSGSINLLVTPATAIMSPTTALNTQHVVGYTEKVYREIEVRAIQTLIPGRKWAYILSCTYDATDSDFPLETCKRIQESFRISERPPRFGPIVMGGLNGGIAAGCGFLLFMLVARLFRSS